MTIRVPGSEHIPFNPINPWGRAAKARGMPDGWKSPLNEPLFQVFVDDRESGRLAIGPKMIRSIADEFHSAVNLAIKSGRIRGWANPHLERVHERVAPRYALET